ncbi:3-isopropylmalate dehydrogenase [Helicocarpus griseus UAMH5409]|uniref:3-isopropylmalate dehydrogenase n=1 Tax=Helicocarpus griseus UAMH5409 TaxID=1447875 RepID=A0A2B7YA94_9EURO|nr:3-isopropylmalate dehydrogenase [Helicocarpus griseus UAMH5409]
MTYPTNHTLLILPGDGIGPEITTEALKIISTISSLNTNHTFTLRTELIGGCSIDAHGTPLTPAVKQAALDADAVLFAAVGGPKWDGVRRGLEGPEGGLLQLRQAMNVYGNLRPCVSPCKAVTRQFSPFKEGVTDGVEFLVLRENCGGAYFGRKVEEPEYAMDEWGYSAEEVRRIARLAAYLALHPPTSSQNSQNPLPILSLDKANVLASSRLWRRIVTETITTEFPQLSLTHQLADSASLIMATNPRALNGVLLADNTFGDMLSDQAGSLVGSLGVLPSASLSGVPGEEGKQGLKGLYEPTHGSAPDIAGKNKANPIAMILCVALMFRYSFNMEAEAQLVERAVSAVLEAGVRTPDLGGKASTAEVGDAVANYIRGNWSV